MKVKKGSTLGAEGPKSTKGISLEFQASNQKTTGHSLSEKNPYLLK
jgi:hypothetical protein